MASMFNNNSATQKNEVTIENVAEGSEVNINLNNSNGDEKSFKYTVIEAVASLEKYIDENGEYIFENNEFENIKRVFNHLKRYVQREENVDKIKEIIKEMKAGSLLLGDDSRLSTLLCFFVLLRVNEGSYDIREEQDFYKVFAELNNSKKIFLLYNTATGNQKEDIRVMGPKIIEYLDSLGYRPSKQEKVLLCNNIFPNCNEACKTAKKIFKFIIQDYTDIDSIDNDFFDVINERPVLTCANCIASFEDYNQNKVKEIFEVIFSDE